MTYPLAFSTWGNEEVEAIKRVIDTDMYTMGKHVKQFEKEFAETFGSPVVNTILLLSKSENLSVVA